MAGLNPLELSSIRYKATVVALEKVRIHMVLKQKKTNDPTKARSHDLIRTIHYKILRMRDNPIHHPAVLWKLEVLFVFYNEGKNLVPWSLWIGGMIRLIGVSQARVGPTANRWQRNLLRLSLTNPQYVECSSRGRIRTVIHLSVYGNWVVKL